MRSICPLFSMCGIPFTYISCSGSVVSWSTSYGCRQTDSMVSWYDKAETKPPVSAPRMERISGNCIPMTTGRKLYVAFWTGDRLMRCAAR